MLIRTAYADSAESLLAVVGYAGKLIEFNCLGRLLRATPPKAADLIPHEDKNPEPLQLIPRILHGRESMYLLRWELWCYGNTKNRNTNNSSNTNKYKRSINHKKNNAIAASNKGTHSHNAQVMLAFWVSAARPPANSGPAFAKPRGRSRSCRRTHRPTGDTVL